MKKILLTLIILPQIIFSQIDEYSVMGLPTAVTSLEMNTVTTAATGSILYNLEENKIFVFDGTNWVSTSNDNWLVNGNTGLPTTSFLGHIDDVKMEIRSNNLPLLQFGRRQTLGLTQTFPDYTNNDQPLVYINGNGNTAALQFAASGASFYKPMFFTTANGSFRLKGSTGGTDLFEIGSAGPANDGRLEFIIGDDGNEKIIFKRYDYRRGQFHREFFRVEGSNSTADSKTRFGININPQEVPIDNSYNNASTGFNTANSTLQLDGSFSTSIINTTGNLTLTEDHHTIHITGPHNITLPNANTCIGRTYILKNSTNTNRTISTYIDLANTNQPVIQRQSVLWIKSDGTNWIQINSSGTTGKIVSTDANNDIITGSDAAAFFESPIKAMGKVATNGNAIKIQGASVVRNSVGNYTVTLNNARSTDDYIIQVSIMETNNYQSSIEVKNQTNNQFTVQVNTRVNGSTTLFINDVVWYFTITDF
ncbi:hypothetical protein [Aquimarina muelleri]|uniref:Uncharacterized protein n=1 Tax=Aquimarina muelleri TaxID=279356 RepID=A0A918JV23_9FLAO|nr:hypothetical protein [Aquimarina muelleri]MCX2764403.1 hypothetical protein [Aquimarina muelleri]GGX21644.1 hypothetical protein GCM10007384_23640 [Aquimarina muelleri]